jgi:molecular chaperone DnaJ
MTDPYKILGVSRSASNAEIKTAYKKLCRKYHPDANVNSPNAKMAEEKFKEIQSAYAMIMEEKKHGSSYNYHSDSSSYYQSEDEIHLQAAINFIQNRRFSEAINVLLQINNRDARWYYLTAIANMGLGRKSIAIENAKRATELEPSNRDYARLYQQLVNGGGYYQNPYSQAYGYGSPYADYQSRQAEYGYNSRSYGSNWCLDMCLLNLLCNCCCRI